MRVNIRTKIFIVLAIFFVEILSFMFLFSMISRRYEQILYNQREDIKRLDLVKDIQIALAQVVMPANDFIITRDKANELQNFKVLSEKTEELIERVDSLGFQRIKEKELVDHLRTEYFQIKSIATEIFSNPDTADNVVVGILMEKMDGISEDALNDAEAFHQFAHERVEKSEIGIQRLKMLFDTVILIGILFNIFLILFGLFFFRRTISLPIESIRDIVLEVAKGNLERKIKIKSNDEIGELATSFNKMTEDLNALILREKEFTEIATKAAEADRKRVIELNRLYEELKEAKENTQRNYEIQAVLNRLLSYSLEDISIEDTLKRFIECITSIPWLTLESRGCIFLVEDKPDMLVMKVERGLAAPLKTMCAYTPFGRCLCGRAALSGKIVFSDCLDERHENRYEGISNHGHYCIPIMSVNKKILGVINLYIKEGRSRNEKEEEFLGSIADVLAGIIERKKIEHALQTAYTRLKETQDQLIQAEKLNAVGLLASGVAHEVRNPLGIIMQGVNYLDKKVSPKEEDIIETLAMVKDSVKRADSIINLLLDFSKASALNLQPEDINSVLEDSLSLVKAKDNLKNTKIISEIKKDIPKVRIDRNRMEQVFVNIFLNAIQAMPDGGEIIIRSYDAYLKEAKSGIGRRKDDIFAIGEKVVIVEIEDTGMGISEENLKRIFDPFFTTKGPKGGIGLGLSVSRNIINMHRGLIEIKSQLNKGTRVVITLKIEQEG